jgi:NAD(P)H-hydrate epimerase
MVIDADGINLLSLNKTWLAFIQANSILTPHPGEFDRLAGSSNTAWERLEKAREISQKYYLILVLKDAYTRIILPDGRVIFNSTGNPGMATAGSGDVLTGIITGLLAQHYTPEEAACIGVFIHGLAGDLAAENYSMQGMIAGDIISSLPAAWKLFHS